MSKIPTNADALIYNDFGSGTGRVFIKHIIKDAFWDEIKGQNVIRMGTVTADSVTMFVDLKPEYVSPAEWRLLTLEEAMSFQYFTIQAGDVIILGTPDAPDTFATTVEIQRFFGIKYAHIISSVDAKIEPGAREIHHLEVSAQ